MLINRSPPLQHVISCGRIADSVDSDSDSAQNQTHLMPLRLRFSSEFRVVKRSFCTSFHQSSPLQVCKPASHSQWPILMTSKKLLKLLPLPKLRLPSALAATPPSGPRLAWIWSCHDAIDISSVVSGRPPEIVEGPDAPPPDCGASITAFNDALESTMQTLETNGHAVQSEVAASALASQQEIAASNLCFESLLDGDVTQRCSSAPAAL